jgi:hypothetical protein
VRGLLPSLAAFAVYVAMAVWRTWPLAASLGTHIASDPGDAYLLTWILAWDAHALWHDPLRLFDGNIFYPHDNVLAFSDHLLGALPVFLPAYLVSGSALIAFNLMFLLSFPLFGWATFCLARHWTGAFWPALAAGALAGFALGRLAQISHAQLLNFFWAPLALLFLDRFIADRRWRSLLACAVFSWLQVLASFYLGVMFLVAMAIAVAYALLTETRERLRLCAQLLVFAGASAVVLLPFHLPYLALQRAWRATRPLPEILFYAPDLASFLVAPPLASDLYLALLRPLAVGLGGNERELFPGLLLPILVIIGLTGRVPGLPADRVRRARWVFGAIVVAGLILALGPYLIVGGRRTHVPLPYLAFYKIVPGWSGMRVPGRFVLLAALGAGPLVALACLRCAALLAARWPLRARWTAAAVAAVVIAFVTVEMGAGHFPMAPAPAQASLPEVYRWLARERPGPVVELPFGQLPDYRYLFLSTAHWLPLVNGQSGYFPPSYSEIEHSLSVLPARSAVHFAAALGVRAIVVHSAHLLDASRHRWFSGEPEANGLIRGPRFGTDLVYLVPPEPVSASLTPGGPLPEVLPAGSRLRLAVPVAGSEGRGWRHPRPHGFVPGLVTWTDAGGARHVATTTTRLPVALAGGAVEPVAIEVQTPARAGRYRLDVTIPALGLSLVRDASVQLVSDRLPDSRRDPAALAAAYDIGGPSGPIATVAADRVMVTLTARNTGTAIWLSEGRRDLGVVRLGWRWLANGVEVPNLSGRQPLSHDVYPGQQYRFRVTLEAPGTPGLYLLELNLLSENLSWFSDLGTPALRIPVSVARAGPAWSEILERAVGAGAGGAPPEGVHLTLSDTQVAPGAVLRVGIRVSRAEVDGPVELVLGGLLPDGQISYVSADRQPTSPSPRRNPVPLAVIAPGPSPDGPMLIDLPVGPDFPQGPYEVFAMLLRPRPGGRPATRADVLALDSKPLLLIESRP